MGKKVTSIMYFGRFSYTREYILYFLNKYFARSSRPALKAATVPISLSKLLLYDFKLDAAMFCSIILDQNQLLFELHIASVRT